MKRLREVIAVLFVWVAGFSRAKYPDCPESCKMALGLESGLVRDDQLTAFSAYQNDFPTFGAHRARLKLKEWSPGYRADSAESTKLPWVRVDFGTELVITGIATQGFGNASVAEWVTSYRLMFAKGEEFAYFMDVDGEVMDFIGNQDSDTIRRNDIRVPAIASSLILVPSTWHNNIGLRMEFYGCEPGTRDGYNLRNWYYFVAWLMLDQISFTLNHMNKSSNEYKSLGLRAVDEVHSHFNTAAGYLYTKFLRLSPQQSPDIATFATAEIAIYCTEESVHHLIATLKQLIISESSVFTPDYLEVQFPLDCRCRPPTVDLELKDSLPEAEVVNTTDSSFFLHTRVTSNCSTSNNTQFKWMLSKIDSETGLFSPFLTYGQHSRDAIKLHPRLMGTGYLYVSVEARVPSVQGTLAYDFGFLRIRRPALIAKVVGPNTVARGIGNVTLSGSQSYDPTVKRFQSRGLKYSWRCRRQCLEDPISSSLLSIAEVEDCFGTSNQTDRIFSIKKSISLDVDSLQSNCTYTFQFSVAKRFRGINRVSHVTHALDVQPAVSFYIRCITNCARKVSPQRMLTLQVSCTDQTCVSKVNFKWTLYVLSIPDGHTDWVEMKNTTGKVRYEVNSTRLQLPRLDALLPIKEGLMFLVRVEATVREGLKEHAVYTFPVNVPPITVTEGEAGCKVVPKEGSAIITDFYISCLGWYDKDTPLRYAFKYKFSSSTIIIQDGNVGNVTTKLPLGDASKGYERLLELQIIDAYGEFSTVFVTTKVKPPQASEALLGLINAARDKMKLLVESNDVNKAADMAITVLSVIDNNEQLRQDESFKDSVLSIMSGVEVNRLNLVTKVTVIVAYSTKRENQSLPQDSQGDALSLLQRTTQYVSTIKNNKTRELNVANDINVNLLTGIGNILVSSSRDTSVDAPKVDASIDINKGKNITKECVELINVFKNKVVQQEGICSRPTVITTLFVNLSTCVAKALDIKVHKLLKGDSGIMLPDARTLFAGQDLDEFTLVDIKLVSYKENPYTWSSNAKNIKSSVLDVNLKNLSSGKPLYVSGLSEPVEMFIKNEQREKEEAGKTEKPQQEFFVQPSSPDSVKNMRYHKFTMPYKDVEARIRIVPTNNVTLEVYIRYRVRSTPAQNQFQTVVPNFSSCLNYSEFKGFYNCHSDPYAFTISPNVTGRVGLHFLGIRYVVEPPSDTESERRRRRAKRACSDVGGRQKRSCVEVKSPPSAVAVTSEFKNGSDVKYTLDVTMGACMYWDEEIEEWTTEGCKVGAQATPGKLQCLCTHLSAFGGDLFVAPNPIDFDKVWAEFGRLGETGNFVVLGFICIAFGLYIVGLVLARRADRRDVYKVAPNVHLMAAADCNHAYEISIQTGFWRGCGTTASVVIVLFGENGCTAPITLSQKHLQQRFFARGSVNTFTIHLPESLGTLFKIQIWHDNSGKSPAWFFHQVLVTDPETQEKWYFLGNRWLALEKGNGEIKAEIKSAGMKESLAFRNLFYFRGAKTLGEKHLWLSLFTKAPHSTFTRCQRLSCCLSILMATMVTNAMFYKQGLEADNTFKVGPLKLSWTQIKIGLQSGLVAIPVNVLVVAIFRNIRPAVSTRSEDDLIQTEETKTNATGCFPHFCVYIGWALCMMSSLVSAAFVVFYSLMWGKTVANQWLSSVMISFFQDVILIQPVKVVMLVSLLSVIIKKPIENDEIHGQEQSTHRVSKKSTSYPPKDEELSKVRTVSVLHNRMVKVVIEIAVSIMFITLLMIVCYGNRNSTRYELTDAVKRLFAGFDKVNSKESFWSWVKKTLVPGLYEVKWYNGWQFSYKEGFIGNREAIVLGMPRLRQQRIKPDPSCEISSNEPFLASKFLRCIPRYTEDNADKTKYNRLKWLPVHNMSSFTSLFDRLFSCPRPWRYETAKELQTRSFQGLFSTYPGGGFVADLGYNTDDAMQVIDSLEPNGWIDNFTAAVFIEFTIYEPASSLFSSVKFLLERFATGNTATMTQVKTLTIYSPQDPSFRGFYETSQLLFMLLVLFCVACELGKLYQQGCAFFKDLWSWMEILLLLSSLLSLSVFFLKESYTSEFIAKVKKNPFQSWSTDSIALWSDLEVTLLSFVVFLVTMKLLRIIRFNPHIIQMMLTLRIAAKNVVSFTIVFLTVIVAYVQFTTLTFGPFVYEYRSFPRSLSSILLMLIGAKAPFHELQEVSIVLGPFFVFAYMISIVMILLNMFLAIINESFSESKRIGIEGLEDLALSRLLKQKAKEVANKAFVVTANVIQTIPRLVRQGPPKNAMTFDGEVVVPFLGERKPDDQSENNEDSAFTEDGDSSLNDVMGLLGDIKDELGSSVMSIDDIVPMVTIEDTDRKWFKSDDSLEDWQRYSCSSLFYSDSSDSAISKSDSRIYHGIHESEFDDEFAVVEAWNRKKSIQEEVFV